MSDLKPCPFCGGEAATNDGGNSVYGRFWWRVGCVKCDVIFSDREVFDADRPGYLDPRYPAKHCFDQWNTRAPVSVQEAAKVLLENISTEGGTGPVYAAFCDLFGSDVDDVDSALRAIAEGGEA